MKSDVVTPGMDNTKVNDDGKDKDDDDDVNDDNDDDKVPTGWVILIVIAAIILSPILLMLFLCYCSYNLMRYIFDYSNYSPLFKFLIYMLSYVSFLTLFMYVLLLDLNHENPSV